jgi:hypothetical protein
LFVVWRSVPPKQHTEISVDPKIFDRYTGLYQAGPQMTIAITREGNHLYAQATGQIRVELFPETEKDDFAKISGIDVTFQTDAQDKTNAMVFRQGGGAVTIRRADGDAPPAPKEHEIVVDPKLFDGYVGRYQFAPPVSLTVTREGSALFAQLTGQEKFQIFPKVRRSTSGKWWMRKPLSTPTRRAALPPWFYIRAGLTSRPNASSKRTTSRRKLSLSLRVGTTEKLLDWYHCSMVVRIRFGNSPQRGARTPKKRRLAQGVASLLTPAALAASILGFWRIGADFHWTSSFAIPSGWLSHWQFWLGAAALLQFCAYALNRYGKTGRTAS